jgi:acetyl-CoA carboxylase biotin carboxyl carrier protein
MNHEQIEALAAVLKDVPSLTEVEVRHGETVLRLRRGGVPTNVIAPLAPATALTSEPVSVAKSAPSGNVVRAPVVGFFHALGGKPTANGDHVRAGQVLGHIETMRLMNDCPAVKDGIVERVLVEDGQPVEYGQALFEIAPSAAR